MSSARYGRVALVHDWLTGMRGGEAVLEAIAELFPEAEIHTLIAFPEKLSPALASKRIHTTWLQKLPQVEKRYRHYLPLMPRAIESLDLSGCDLIISSSHCVAKGIRKPKGSVHISYIHAPMRYMWDRFDDYFGKGQMSVPVRMGAKVLRRSLQNWDRRVSQEPALDHLIANSHFIAAQIKEHYGRTAEVIHPFVDLGRFSSTEKKDDFYLIVSAFAPYKRLDLAIRAFNELGLPLKIVGKGQEEGRLKRMAGPTIEFVGSVGDSEVARLYSRAKALVFPGIEDFGITPLEAMASGTPVIGFGCGGVTETVTPETGILFAPQDVEALKFSVGALEAGAKSFSSEICRARAEEFSKEKFKREMSDSIERVWGEAKAESSASADAVL